MEIRQLELFLAVIDCNSVTRAAEKACVSPGAISMQMRSLADELHTDLFVRSGKHLVPTPAALRLAGSALNTACRHTNRETGVPSLQNRPATTPARVSLRLMVWSQCGHTGSVV